MVFAMHILTAQELDLWLENHPEWSSENNLISTQYKFKNFVEAFGFISKLAIEMERANHHATITNTYNSVHISMNTHDAGGKITDKDTNLAETIQKLKEQ